MTTNSSAGGGNLATAHCFGFRSNSERPAMVDAYGAVLVAETRSGCSARQFDKRSNREKIELGFIEPLSSKNYRNLYRPGGEPQSGLHHIKRGPEHSRLLLKNFSSKDVAVQLLNIEGAAPVSPQNFSSALEWYIKSLFSKGNDASSSHGRSYTITIKRQAEDLDSQFLSQR